MKASINSKYYRTAGNSINFDIDEPTFKRIGQKKIAEVTYLNGDIVWAVWDYNNKGTKIEVSNIRLSQDDYNLLAEMKEDNTYLEYFFNYVDKTWPVYITDVQKSGNEYGKTYTAIQMLVTGDSIDMETA